MRNRIDVTSIYKASIRFSARTADGSLEKYMLMINVTSEMVIVTKPIRAVICDGFLIGFLIRFMSGSLHKMQDLLFYHFFTHRFTLREGKTINLAKFV